MKICKFCNKEIINPYSGNQKYHRHCIKNRRKEYKIAYNKSYMQRPEIKKRIREYEIAYKKFHKKCIKVSREVCEELKEFKGKDETWDELLLALLNYWISKGGKSKFKEQKKYIPKEICVKKATYFRLKDFKNETWDNIFLILLNCWIKGHK